MGVGVTLASQRYPYIDGRAALPTGFDLQAATRERETFADTEQAEVANAKGQVCRSARGVEAATVILDDQPKLLCSRLQDHANPVGARMLHHVGNRLLQHTEYRRLKRMRQALVTELDLQINLQPGPVGPFLEVLGDRAAQTEIIQRPRPQ